MQFIQNQGILINVSFNNHIEASVSMDELIFLIYISTFKLPLHFITRQSFTIKIHHVNNNVQTEVIQKIYGNKDISHIGLGHRQETAH